MTCITNLHTNLAETGMPTRLLRQSNLNAWSSKRPVTATITAAKTTSDDDGRIFVVESSDVLLLLSVCF